MAKTRLPPPCRQSWSFGNRAERVVSKRSARASRSRYFSSNVAQISPLDILYVDQLQEQSGFSQERRAEFSRWQPKGTLYFRPEYRYISKFSFDLGDRFVARHQDLLDVRLGLRSQAAGWSVTGWVKNALDNKITQSYQPAVLTGHPLGIDAFYPPVGTTYGIELGYQF